jgi:hypothetical protein
MRRDQGAIPRRALWSIGAALVLAAAVLSGAVLAQSSSATYQVPRQSIDGGAGRATSPSYTLNSTIGQPDAGVPMTSASYQLRGGFHVAAPLPPRIFGDGFEAQ